MPRLMASRASSGGVQCDTGTPLCDGGSQANAMIAVICSGVNVGGAPHRSSSMTIPMMSFSRSLSDASRFSAAAQCGSRFERIEKIGAYSCAGHALGAIVPRQVEVAHSPCEKILENLIVFAPVQEVRRGSADFVSLLCINFPSRHKLFGVRKLDGSDHPLPHHVEKQCAGSNTKRKRQHDHNCYGGRPGERAEGADLSLD